MRTDELDFELPAELIAQMPTERRGDSRLLHYRRANGAIAHRQFADLAGMLRAGDLLVVNDARVLPARFVLRKETGGLVDGLFLKRELDGTWRVILRNVGAGAVGKRLRFADGGIGVTIIKQAEGGEYVLAVDDPR